MDYDRNKDGKVDQDDLQIAQQISKIEIDKHKDKNQVRLAQTAIASIIVVTLLLFCPAISDSRIAAIGDILDVFYVAQASIIGFYVGANTYLSRNK